MARAACPPPLAPTLVAVVLGSWLIPTWLQRSQDRQAELKVKADLVEQIATDTTTSVRHPIVLVLQHGAPESASPSASLKHEYFAADVVTSFISIPQPDVASASAVAQLK